MEKCELCKTGEAVVEIRWKSKDGLGTIPYRGVISPGCCDQCFKAIYNKVRQLAGMKDA